MTKKELKEYRKMVWTINQIKEEIHKLQTNLHELFPEINNKNSMKKDVIVLIEKIYGLKSLYLNILIKLYSKQIEIETAISSLPLREQLLIRLKYIDGKTWEEVSETLNYSYQHVHRIHSTILDELEEK